MKLTRIEPLGHQVSLRVHDLLEDEIKKHNGLPEWLWCHERWNAQQKFQLHLRHRHKRSSAASSLSRTNKFWIRMPNWLGDVVMTFPLLDAIRRGRPDAFVTVLAKQEFKGLLESLNLVDHFLPIPQGSINHRLKVFREYKRQFPSVIINFANSFRSDLECYLIGAPRRYGLTFPGRFRPFLTHSFFYAEERDGPLLDLHQVRLWEKFLQYFGLNEKLDFPDTTTHKKNSRENRNSSRFSK